ncbi:histidine phosphatase family protein [Undibacterium sp. Dicai25W]|uniref:histidine phosphatase family protein n=1 Tax=Undibacterium sp. Dicai25W TaxID=3413034 RepID=UPI003BF2340A
MRLYLIRHTKPDIAPGICYGQSDVPVKESDIAELVPTFLCRWSDSVPVYTSPLSRCLKLAQQLHSHPIVDARLMELNFGAWEMQTWEQIPRWQIDAWASDTVHYAPGEGENVMQMTTRVIAFISDLQQHAVEQAVVICHSGIIKILSTWQRGNTSVDLAQRVAKLHVNIEFGSCTELEILM